MAEPSNRGHEVEVLISPGDPMHPGGDSRPAWAIAVTVGDQDLAWMQQARERSVELARQRGHLRS